jgi:hypothetical protein
MRSFHSRILAMMTAALFITASAHAIDTSSMTPRIAPSLDIASALKIAEEYYQKKEDPKAGRFIERVHYVESNQSQPEKGPFWVFRYVLPYNVDGGEVFVSVYMDGTTSVFRGQ